MATFEQILCEFLANPIVYFLIVFVFAIAVAIILPIPIEIALVFALTTKSLALFTVALFAVALGKAVGAWLVFILGVRVEHAMSRWAQRSRILARIFGGLERLVHLTRSFGLFLLLSIPFMSDTAVLYFYALFNKDGKSIDHREFIVTNFLAGISRTAAFFILALTILPGLLGSTTCAP